MIPKSLRTWFVVHFILDFAFGIPLLFAPDAFLAFFGWQGIDPIATRLVGAALMGIGGESWIGRNAGLEAYRGMLNLKIIWSATATLGVLATMLTTNGPWGGWLIVVIFAPFCALWTYYRIRLNKTV